MNQQPDNPGQDRTAAPLVLPAAAVRDAHAALGQLLAGSGKHVYLSAGCLHGEHAYCQGKAGLAGAKVPASCKFCGAPCQCPCHPEAGE